MSDELDYSAEEAKYFGSGGDLSPELAKELGGTPPTAEKPEPAPAPEPARDQTPPAAEPDDADDEGDDPPAPVAKDGQPAPQPERRGRRVSRKEFDAERQARQAAEQRYNDQRVQQAKIEERLSLLQQALQEPAQVPVQEEVPDPEKDIFAYVRYLESQINATTSKVNTYEEQLTHGQQEIENERRYLESLNDFAGTQRDFPQAYTYLIRSRAAELVARSYQNVTTEQLQGIMDGRIRIPKPVADALKAEERELYRSAFDSNRDPAATIYQYATMRGYRTPTAPQPAQKQETPAGGTPGTSLGAAPAAASAGAAPTASDVIASIQKGQPAAASLSKAGGTAPDAELTPEAVANMTDEQFEALFNKLQASGNKDKLRAVFGA